MKNRNALRLSLVVALAALGMGITMPSCPGQEAMQQQIDALQTKNAELTRKVTALEATTKKISDDMGKMTQLLAEMTNTIQAQKGAMDQMSGAIKELQARAAAPAPAPKSAGKGAAKRRR